MITTKTKEVISSSQIKYYHEYSFLQIPTYRLSVVADILDDLELYIEYTVFLQYPNNKTYEKKLYLVSITDENKLEFLTYNDYVIFKGIIKQNQKIYQIKMDQNTFLSNSNLTGAFNFELDLKAMSILYNDDNNKGSSFLKSELFNKPPEGEMGDVRYLNFTTHKFDYYTVENNTTYKTKNGNGIYIFLPNKTKENIKSLDIFFKHKFVKVSDRFLNSDVGKVYIINGVKCVMMNLTKVYNEKHQVVTNAKFGIIT